jgi:hypothetical protein
MDRSRYDSAMFWLAFGTAAAVIGLALMTIGITRLPAAGNPLTSAWFDGGLALLGLGALLLLWALLLFLSRRRATVDQPGKAGGAGSGPVKRNEMAKYLELWSLWRFLGRRRDQAEGAGEADLAHDLEAIRHYSEGDQGTPPPRSEQAKD